MGGRGGSSGLSSNAVKAVIIDINGSKITYRQRGDHITSLSGQEPKQTGIFKTVKDIIKNADQKGLSYTTLNDRQLKDYDEQRKKDRKITDKQLNDLWYKAAPKKRKGWKGH